MPTLTAMDIEVKRLVREEVQREEAARVERIRQTVLAQQAAEQAEQEHVQRIADLRAQAAAKREQAAAISAEAEPHLAALERIEGVRPYFAQSRSISLYLEADHIDRSIEWLEQR